MTEPSGHCPFLGLKQNRAIRFASPTPEHRCYVTGDPQEIPVDQATYCLSSGHVQCPLYMGLPAPTTPPSALSPQPLPRGGLVGWLGGLSPRDRVIYGALLALLVAIIGIYAVAGAQLLSSALGQDLPPSPLPAAATAVQTTQPATSASPTLAATNTAASTATRAATATIAATSTDIPVSPTAPIPTSTATEAVIYVPPIPTDEPPPADTETPPPAPTETAVAPTGATATSAATPATATAAATAATSAPTGAATSTNAPVASATVTTAPAASATPEPPPPTNTSLPQPTSAPPAPEPTLPPPTIAPATPQFQAIPATLYFADGGRGALYVGVRRAVRADDGRVAEAVARALLAGPRAGSGLAPVLASGIRLLGTRIDGDMLLVDLDRSPGDDRAFYALALSLTELPGVARVQVLVHGVPAYPTGAVGPLTRPLLNPDNPAGHSAAYSSGTRFLPLFFRYGGYQVRVTRLVARTDDVAAATVRELLVGPGAAYAGLLESSIPQGVMLRDLTLRGEEATVNMSAAFANAANRRAAVDQLVLSLTELRGAGGERRIASVVIQVEGRNLGEVWGAGFAGPFARPAANAE